MFRERLTKDFPYPLQGESLNTILWKEKNGAVDVIYEK